MKRLVEWWRARRNPPVDAAVRVSQLRYVRFGQVLEAEDIQALALEAVALRRHVEDLEAQLRKAGAL